MICMQLTSGSKTLPGCEMWKPVLSSSVVSLSLNNPFKNRILGHGGTIMKLGATANMSTSSVTRLVLCKSEKEGVWLQMPR
jgi:hypothetical protein